MPRAASTVERLCRGSFVGQGWSQFLFFLLPHIQLLIVSLIPFFFWGFPVNFVSFRFSAPVVPATDRDASEKLHVSDAQARMGVEEEKDEQVIGGG